MALWRRRPWLSLPINGIAGLEVSFSLHPPPFPKADPNDDDDGTEVEEYSLSFLSMYCAADFPFWRRNRDGRVGIRYQVLEYSYYGPGRWSRVLSGRRSQPRTLRSVEMGPRLVFFFFSSPSFLPDRRPARTGFQ